MHESIREIMLNKPTTLVLLFSAWVPLCLWAALIVGWMIQGDIDSVVGLFALAASAVITALASTSSNNALPYYSFISYASLALFPILKYVYDRYQTVQLDHEAVDRAYLVLGTSPNNPALRFRLARTLYDSGLVDIAIAVGEKAIGNLPLNSFKEEHKDLAGWRIYGRENPQQVYVCPYCGFDIQLGEVYCQTCGRGYLALLVRGKWHSQQLMKRIICVWVALVLVFLGTFYAFNTYAIGIAVVLSVFFVGIALFALYRGFQPPEVYA